mmetsp:Transcript_50112/g.154853  ORF Transcript_50112/g.154853 Transcript_50112/m.154853 type:complete len:219 (+) Transcript_50112:1975-2631(+)
MTFSPFRASLGNIASMTPEMLSSFRCPKSTCSLSLSSIFFLILSRASGGFSWKGAFQSLSLSADTACALTPARRSFSFIRRIISCSLASSAAVMTAPPLSSSAVSLRSCRRIGLLLLRLMAESGRDASAATEAGAGLAGGVPGPAGWLSWLSRPFRRSSHRSRSARRRSSSSWSESWSRCHFSSQSMQNPSTSSGFCVRSASTSASSTARIFASKYSS